MRPFFRHLLPLAALLAAGCELYPEDPIFAYGQVLRTDGTPVSGATLSFERALSSWRGGVPTLNPPEFSPHASAITRAEGAFTLELLAGATSERVMTGGYYDWRSYRFRVVSQEEGRAAILSFELSGGDVELPSLRPWAADLSVGDGTEGHVAVSFAPVPLRPELPPTGTWRVSTALEPGEVWYDEATTPRPVVQLLQRGGAVLWQEEAAGSPWMAAPWLREDFDELEVMVRAQSSGEWQFEPLGGRVSSVGYRLEWRSERLPMPGAGLHPISRGASCEPLPAGVTACPWTDGQLASVKFSPVSSQSERWPQELRLTLAAPARPSRIVVRGLAADYVNNPLKTLFVEGSEDGERWVSLGQVIRPSLGGTDRGGYRDHLEVLWAADNPLDPALEVDLSTNLYLEGALHTEVAVRHVRLRGVPIESSRPVELKALKEVSLFE